MCVYTTNIINLTLLVNYALVTRNVNLGIWILIKNIEFPVAVRCGVWVRTLSDRLYDLIWILSVGGDCIFSRLYWEQLMLLTGYMMVQSQKKNFKLQRSENLFWLSQFPFNSSRFCSSKICYNRIIIELHPTSYLHDHILSMCQLAGYWRRGTLTHYSLSIGHKISID